MDDLDDLAIFNFLELGRADRALLVLGARLLDRRGAQNAADMIGAERRLGSLRHRVLRKPAWLRVLMWLSHSTADAVSSTCGFACVTCGFKRAAEREIMRRGVAQIGGLRERFKDAVRTDMADESAGCARHQAAQRSSNAAALGVAQQRRHAGRTGHADFHRLGYAAGAQLPQPG